MQHKILFFADRLPPLSGGMEIHGKYFIEHFINHPRFPISHIITKDSQARNCILEGSNRSIMSSKNLADLLNPSFIFFNSGRWIEELKQIRKLFPKAIFLYRTGGNEIIKAPLTAHQIHAHHLRQAYWTRTLNETMDMIITNSAFTEMRLRKIGLLCPFMRFVGGVNVDAIKLATKANNKKLTIFCAARFVPYKNHSLLLKVVQKLILRGKHLQLRLAGDGPLFSQIQKQARRNNLMPYVEFLGVLNHPRTCQEIAQADVYMQLSTDLVTQVPGGSYIHSEGMGRSILEALSAGTFVIAGRSGALPEIVTADRGQLIELDNLDPITDRIEKILNNLPPRATVSDIFSWNNIFKGYEKLLGKFSENIVSH